MGTQTDQPTPPVSPARAPAAPPTHHLTQTEEEELLTHAQRERWADYRRRERLEARWHEQAAERGVVAHTTAYCWRANRDGGRDRSAQRAVLEARAVLLADQLRRRASGAAAEGEAQTTASAAHRSAQRAVQEAMRREELRRRGELDEAEAVEHYEYEEYNNTSPRRSRSRSRPRTVTWSRPTDEVEEEWSWEVRSHSE